MVEQDFFDKWIEKVKGKPWSSWNLPDQPDDLGLKKLRKSFQQPEQQQSTPLSKKFLLLFGIHPDSDYISLTKCPACGWLLKIQHANRHFLRDSRGAVVCRELDLAIFGSKVLGKSLHPLVELRDTYSRKIKTILPPPNYNTSVNDIEPKIPEKRIKLNCPRSSNHHHHKSSSMPQNDNHDSYSKSISKYSKSVWNVAFPSQISSDTTKRKRSKGKASNTSSSSSNSKSETTIPSKHHVCSTSSSTGVTTSKPIVSVSSLSSSSSSSSHSRSPHHSSSISASSSSSDRDRDMDQSSLNKKRKMEKNEARKNIPLKDRDFNPDIHCGVCTPPSAVPCKRLLTCKTHSVALRRAVVGRSQSLDALMAAHKLAKTEEKKSQVKEAVTPEVTPPKSKKFKKKKRSGSSLTNVGSSTIGLGNLAGTVKPISYGQSTSPDIEVIAVKAKAKPPPVRPEVTVGIVKLNSRMKNTVGVKEPTSNGRSESPDIEIIKVIEPPVKPEESVEIKSGVENLVGDVEPTPTVPPQQPSTETEMIMVLPEAIPPVGTEVIVESTSFSSNPTCPLGMPVEVELPAPEANSSNTEFNCSEYAATIVLSHDTFLTFR